MKKTAIVDIKGGLGNQIFIISFANCLKNYGFNVLLDTSFYKSSHDFQRDLLIDINEFGFKEISLKHNRIFKITNSLFEEISNLEKIKPKFLNRFTGYYQNTSFIDKSFLEKKLSLPKTKIQNSVMMHIRRSDYIELNEDLKIKYYKSALNKIENKILNCEINIFSDDSNLNIKDFKNFNVSKIFNNLDDDPLEIFKEMTRHQNFIISNSTYSFLAAFLGQQENSEIYYPNPWMRNSDFSINNIPKNWIQIKNKI